MAAIPRLHLPMRAPTDVIPHLGAPHHYKEGRSARLIAETWFKANSVPEAVLTVLNQVPCFTEAELVDAFLERCIELGDGAKPSQTDLLAVLGLPDALVIMAVEGKVDESFGELVSEWSDGASPKSKKPERLKRLTTTLGLDIRTVAPLRYQLLHRTASAIYEAQRYRSKTAIMMVHSFDARNAGLADFKLFAVEMGLPEADAGRVVGPITREGVSLYLGWAADPPV